ncbi:MAG TPA: Rieske 2Fe-2S domain-containing protein [Pseudonocardiaceae bacterium]|nr:Rieske 2Fe-2S domain-containing protein [Pseudonocardiaceae bacterium]
MVRLPDNVPVVHIGPVETLFRRCRRVVVTVIRTNGTVDEFLVILGRRDRLFATVNRCPHLGRRLDDAPTHGCRLTCPGHGRSFDLRTGAPARPGTGPLPVARAWLKDGQAFLRVRS